MIDIKNLARENILTLKPYSSARDEFIGKEGVFIDANENPFGTLNRYPDPGQRKLKEKLSEVKSVGVENIFIGNGSDEVIDLCFRIFCNPQKDNVVICPPTYGMYEVCAAVNNVEARKAKLNSEFQLDMDEILKSITSLDSASSNQGVTKMIIICSPNNPTGNCIDNIEEVLQKFNGIVIIDEAYIDFSKKPSLIDKIRFYPNLVVMQTFSKAWGLAAARVGMAYANSEIIALLKKVKPPYNVSELNQQAALNALGNIDEYAKCKNKILEQKALLERELKSIPVIKKVYPSDANFLLVEVDDAERVYSELLKKQVIVRNRDSLVRNCIRITVGSPEENEQLIKVLRMVTGNG